MRFSGPAQFTKRFRPLQIDSQHLLRIQDLASAIASFVGQIDATGYPHAAFDTHQLPRKLARRPIVACLSGGVFRINEPLTGPVAISTHSQ